MCGRYRLSRRAEILASYFYAEYEGMDWEARYNIAPTQAVPVIRQDPREPVRRASLMRWGLVLYWAKDASVGYKMINARSETAAEKPAFKESLQRRRCLIPADEFYEWPRRVKAKQAFHFGLQDDSLFAFAGLWDRWRGSYVEREVGDSVLVEIDWVGAVSRKVDVDRCVQDFRLSDRDQGVE
jgi:putative SOS response-associated peptidase YedK